VKGLEKLRAIRLAEILSQKGMVETNAITDALYAQDQFGEPFVEALIGSGQISEWDLAKLVVEHFQLPFIMASSYDIGQKVKESLPADLLFNETLVPMDAIGDMVMVAMPILSPYELLDKVQRKFKCRVYPYVGLMSENKKVLSDLYPEYKTWLKARDEAREKKIVATPKVAEERSWMNMFDTADAAVKNALGEPAASTRTDRALPDWLENLDS
jgi:hypothetical protein